VIPTEDGDWLTIFEVSDELGVSPRAVIEMIENGDLDATRVGKATMVRRGALEHLLQSANRQCGRHEHDLNGICADERDPEPATAYETAPAGTTQSTV